MKAFVSRSALQVLGIAAILVAAACTAPPPLALEVDYDIVPLLQIDKRWAGPGSPVELTYRFDVAADNGPIEEDYEVSVDFVGADNEVIFSDHHLPPVPTSSWVPGSSVQYARTVFVPYDAEAGPLTVELGLIVAGLGRYIVLAGGEGGTPAVVSKAGRLTIDPRVEGMPISYKSGWLGIETDADNPALRWQWTEDEALSSFPNPRSDAVLYLHALANVVPGEELPEVSIRVGPGPGLLEVARFRVEQPGPFLERIYVPAKLMGATGTVELLIRTDAVVVPAEVGSSSDPRRLGLRVFNLYVEPEPNWTSYHLEPTKPVLPGERVEPPRGESELTEGWAPGTVPEWDRALAPLKGKPDIHYLEIGVFEGRSYVWMAENVFTHPTSTLTGIDLFAAYEELGGEAIRARFLDNVRRAGISSRSTLYAVSPPAALRELPYGFFDAIYVHGVRDAAAVLEDATLCRRLLKDGGILIFGDYDRPTDPGVKFAADTFVRIYGADYSIVHRGYELVLRKGERF